MINSMHTELRDCGDSGSQCDPANQVGRATVRETEGDEQKLNVATTLLRKYGCCVLPKPTLGRRRGFGFLTQATESREQLREATVGKYGWLWYFYARSDRRPRERCLEGAELSVFRNDNIVQRTGWCCGGRLVGVLGYQQAAQMFRKLANIVAHILFGDAGRRPRLSS